MVINFKIIAHIIFFVTLPLRSFAQDFNGLNTYLQRTRVGLVDEFIDRFNAKETHPDIPLSTPDSKKKNLLMLFDIYMFKSTKDPRYKEAQQMIDEIINKKIKINYSDETWTALAHCQGVVGGKNVKFDIYLTVEKRGKDMYKWVISNVKGSIFDVSPKNKTKNIMLYPDDHETNFISLHRMTTEQPGNVSRFMNNDFNYNATSVFVFLVYNGLLKINYVDDLEFIFTQVPGYTFHIRYFQREKNNAGWLISKFYKSNAKEKAQFWKSVLGKTH